MPILKRNGKTFSGTPTKVDTAKSYTTFDSADDKNPTTWSDVELLTSKEEQRSLFSKISTMFKNIRYLYKILGTTDISHYSDGTVTGAIKAACDKSDANETAIADVNSKLGNTDISAIGDGTLTGGLSILNNNAYDLKMLGWTVPKECPVQNYVDEDGVFHQIVGRVDLSKLMWEWADTLNEFRTDLYIMGMNPYSTNIYCSKYKLGSEMYISGMGIYIKDPNYDSSTISQFKADNKGVYFYYELATEITKPVDGNEAIKLLNDKLGNTDISAIGDGTVTGGLDALNSNFTWKRVGAEHKGVPISYPSEFNELYVLVDYGMFGVYDEVTVIKNFLNNPRTIQRGSSEKTGFELVFGTNNVKLQWAYIETQVPENAEITLYYR